MLCLNSLCFSGNYYIPSMMVLGYFLASTYIVGNVNIENKHILPQLVLEENLRGRLC